jgi:hypothetical protein
MVQPMPYTAFQAILDANNPPGMLNYHRGLHLASLPDGVIDHYLAVGRQISSPLTAGLIFHHGGAIAAVDENATAVSDRRAPYMAHPIACWATPEETDAEMEWVRQFSAAVATATTGGTYLNFEPGTTLADVRSGFGEEKYARLVELKDRWDPDNVFRSNHNIPPTGWTPPATLPMQPRG